MVLRVLACVRSSCCQHRRRNANELLEIKLLKKNLIPIVVLFGMFPYKWLHLGSKFI